MLPRHTRSRRHTPQRGRFRAISRISSPRASPGHGVTCSCGLATLVAGFGMHTTTRILPAGCTCSPSLHRALCVQPLRDHHRQLRAPPPGERRRRPHAGLMNLPNENKCSLL